jgi:hypothetical protein
VRVVDDGSVMLDTLHGQRITPLDSRSVNVLRKLKIRMRKEFDTGNIFGISSLKRVVLKFVSTIFIFLLGKTPRNFSEFASHSNIIATIWGVYSHFVWVIGCLAIGLCLFNRQVLL